jgi:hypothetical protein
MLHHYPLFSKSSVIDNVAIFSSKLLAIVYR